MVSFPFFPACSRMAAVISRTPCSLPLHHQCSLLHGRKSKQMRHCNTTPLHFLIRSNANRSVRIPGLNASSQVKASKPHFSRTGFWTSNATSCEMLTAVVETPKPHCQEKQLYDISFLFCRLCWNQHCDPGKYFKKNLNILGQASVLRDPKKGTKISEATEPEKLSKLCSHFQWDPFKKVSKKRRERWQRNDRNGENESENLPHKHRIGCFCWGPTDCKTADLRSRSSSNCPIGMPSSAWGKLTFRSPNLEHTFALAPRASMLQHISWIFITCPFLFAAFACLRLLSNKNNAVCITSEGPGTTFGLATDWLQFLLISSHGRTDLHIS